MPQWMYRTGLGLSAAGAIGCLAIIGPGLILPWMTLGVIAVLAAEDWITAS